MLEDHRSWVGNVWAMRLFNQSTSGRLLALLEHSRCHIEAAMQTTDPAAPIEMTDAASHRSMRHPCRVLRTSRVHVIPKRPSTRLGIAAGDTSDRGYKTSDEPLRAR